MHTNKRYCDETSLHVLRASCLKLEINEFRCWMLWGKNRGKWKRPAAIGSRAYDCLPVQAFCFFLSEGALLLPAKIKAINTLKVTTTTEWAFSCTNGLLLPCRNSILGHSRQFLVWMGTYWLWALCHFSSKHERTSWSLTPCIVGYSYHWSIFS